MGTDYQKRRVEERQKQAMQLAELAKEYGVEGHPKLGLLYQIAWDYGHSSGYEEVEIHFAQLVPLIQ
jgi:hypothetical protein